MTFLPLALLAQFKRWANFFYTIIAFMSLYREWATGLNQYAYTIPVLLGITVGIMTAAIEDSNRKREDRLTNNQTCSKLSNGQFIQTTWERL